MGKYIEGEGRPESKSSGYIDTGSKSSGTGSESSGTSSGQGGKTKDKTGDCFVATAAYGTPWAPEIQVLRNWRDTKLTGHSLGRRFIRFYYKNGPAMARVVKKSDLLRGMARGLIRLLIKVIR